MVTGKVKRINSVKRIIITIAGGVVMLACVVSGTAASEITRHAPVMGAAYVSLECEGNACTNVSVTFDEAKQQYKVQNNSERTVRVEASNWAGGQKILVEAGKTVVLEMKSIVGSYRANYETVSGS